jgi:curli biogenesis system outer membrane secretion channel CsgG
MMPWLVLILSLLAWPALADPVEVDVSGTGATRPEAVGRGLAEAIQQVTGVLVEVDQKMQTAMAATSVNDTSVVSLAAASQDSIRRTANGIVRSYRIIETEADEPAHVVLRMTVTVEKFEAKALGNESRRRIAVTSFGGPSTIQGIVPQLRDRVISYLTQARRFAVLDRANLLAYSQEMATLETQAPVTERVRVGQVIGADYVVVGAIRGGVSRSDRTIELTGERVISASSELNVDWQVLEIATRQVKWAGNVRLNSGDDALGGLVDKAAARIADEITQAIYPMRLVDATDPAALIINQGGGTLRPGQRFRAMLLGKQIIDPYTKEPLGQVEREVGVVEIVRVDNKVAYARLASGKLPGEEAEIVLRPAASAAARPQGSARAAAPTLVKLPGDP